MTDLVVTCPKWFWADWLAEGDTAGTRESGQAWGWKMRCKRRPPIDVGERLYVAAHGMLRGFAPVIDVLKTVDGWEIVRQGGAHAVTITTPILGFRGWRYRWWDREVEQPFPDWKIDGVRA